MTPFDRAIAICHGSSRLAAAIGERPSTVGNWHKRGVPLDRCAAIEAATSGQVRCEDLRSDVAWTRDEHGHVTGYHVRVDAPTAAARAAKAA